MYIVDWIGEPLCDRCSDVHIEGGPPVWQPDARARKAMLIEKLIFMRKLPQGYATKELSDIVASFLHHDWSP